MSPVRVRRLWRVLVLFWRGRCIRRAPRAIFRLSPRCWVVEPCCHRLPLSSTCSCCPSVVRSFKFVCPRTHKDVYMYTVDSYVRAHVHLHLNWADAPASLGFHRGWIRCARAKCRFDLRKLFVRLVWRAVLYRVGRGS